MGQKAVSLGLDVGRTLRRAENRWVHRCLFHHFCGQVCHSLAREVTSRGTSWWEWGEATPRTHRKPEEVPTFNFFPCLAGKRVKSLTSDAEEKCLCPVRLHSWESLPLWEKSSPFVFKLGTPFGRLRKGEDRQSEVAIGSGMPLALQPPQPPLPSQPSASSRPSRMHSQDSLPWAPS